MTLSYSPTVVSPLPGSVPLATATLKLWGDEASGYVNDWIYVNNEKIQQLVFSLPSGARFGHSEQYRTNMGADEIFCVLSGVLVLANPETGEVHRLEPGDTAWFGPDTWHHGFSRGTETLRVLEFFAPPPATGSSQPYANTKPYLSEPSYTRDEWVGQWPAAQPEAAEGHTQHIVRPEEIMWRLEGDEHPLLVGLYLSTDQLTAGVVELLPGERSEPRMHAGDLTGYVEHGELNLCLLDPSGNPRSRQWFQSQERDGFFVPEGTAYQFFNMTDAPVKLLFAVAPGYLRNGN